MNTALKGDDKKRNENCELKVLASEELQKENVFNLLLKLNIKYIFVLCCHGFYQEPYQKDGVIIKPFFNNKGKVLGEFNILVPNEYRFVTEEYLAA